MKVIDYLFAFNIVLTVYKSFLLPEWDFALNPSSRPYLGFVTQSSSGSLFSLQLLGLLESSRLVLFFSLDFGFKHFFAE